MTFNPQAYNYFVLKERITFAISNTKDKANIVLSQRNRIPQ